jgi:hypothetical protein
MEAALRHWDGYDAVHDEHDVGVVLTVPKQVWRAAGPPRKRIAVFRPPVQSREDEFNTLVEEWRRDTELVAFVERKAMHWAYQRILGMGDDAVPLMLRRLVEEAEPDHWFWALSAITGEDPAAGTTTLDDASDRWIAWGRGRGLV